MTDGADSPPISRLIDVSTLEPAGRPIAFALDEGERQRLADAFDLLELPEAAIEGHIWPADDGVFVQFHLTARVVQRCVVSLEPVASDIDEEVRLHYTPRAALLRDPKVVDIADEDDPPEPMVDGKIDLGVSVAEHLALALDPYPRRADAELAPELAQDKRDPKANPFAVLAQLKRDDE